MTSSRGTIRQRLSDALTLVAVVVTCLFLLSGCLINRVQQVKAQTCDFERNFTFESGAVSVLTFHEPVLLKTDLEHLLDFEPVEMTLSETRLSQRYQVVQVAADGRSGSAYEFAWHFVASGEDWRLASVHMLLKEAKDRGADILSVVCPLCQFNLDAYQDRVKAKYGLEPIPVVYLPQLMGWAFGIQAKKLGLHRGMVPAQPVVTRRAAHAA